MKPKANKKIAIVSPVFPPYRGGMATVSLQHAELLAHQGFDVTVFTPEYRADYAEEMRNTVRNFLVKPIKPLFAIGNAAYVPQLEKKLAPFGTVLLEYPFFGGMRAVYAAKKKYGFRLVMHYNMDNIASGAKGMLFWYAKKFFLPRIVRSANVVFALTEDYGLHSDLGAYWKKTSEKFQNIPIAIDTDRFAPAASTTVPRAEFGIAPHERVALFVGGLGRAHYFKGIEYLIGAVAFIQAEYHDPFKIVIAGSGDLVKKYKEFAHSRGVADYVLFTGAVSDTQLVSLYQRADVTVLPSIDRSESFGIVLAESMACATPVIASDLVGVRSVFENNVSGYIVPPANAHAIAEKITYLFSHPEKAAHMGKMARSYVETAYTPSIVESELARAIQPE